MSAIWAKNEVTAVKRRCGLLVRKNDDTFAPRGTDFNGVGVTLVCGVNSPDFDDASGTVTNQRRLLGFESNFTIEAVDAVTDDTLQLTGHDFETGDGPVQFSGGDIPDGLVAATDYWLIKFDVDNVQVAETLADAYAGTFIDLLDAGSGTITLVATGLDTERGLDGHFVYEATQAETNHNARETIVIIDMGGGSDYDRDLDGGAYTSVAMEGSGDDVLDAVLESGHTVADALRVILRTCAANFAVSAGVQTFRDIADTKDSHHATITSTSRTDATIDDAT